MAGNAELQRKLNQGVEAAKAGDRGTARRLLEEVVEQDDRNELAWIWLATVATGAAERREYLKKVLSINPRNQRAREALSRLGDEPVVTPVRGRTEAQTLQESARRTDALAGQRRGGSTGLIFVIAAGAFLLAGLGIILFGSGALNPSVPTASPRAVSQDLPTGEPTQTTTPQPSSTPVPIELITRSAPTLPPTATSTLTPTATATIQVTQPFELSAFEIYYVSQDPAEPEPALFSVQADGVNDGLIEFQMRDVAFAADGFTFAFVRDIVNESGTRVPEIFVTTLGNVSIVTQVTSIGAADTANPSFSPDGSMLVFSSSNGRSAPELWVVSADGGTPAALTETEGGEREPAWSPAGGQIAYTSDQGGIGSTEIYILAVTENGEPLGGAIQVTDSDRNSYSPSWSLDGRTIAFASDRTGDGDIYTMDSQGNNEQLVTIDDQDAEDRRPSLSADGRWIAFVSNREDGNFQTFVIRNNGTNARRVTTNLRVDVSAVFRPRSLTE